MAAFVEVVKLLSLLALLNGCTAQQEFTAAQIPDPFRVGDTFPPRSEIEVCRRIEDRIERNSQRFASQLVTNTNPGITFATSDARIMSSRLQSRLDNLQREFDRRITVLKAWTPYPDSDLNGDPNSLHYEGRTVSVTIDGGSSSNYDQLLKEAVDAQFDWVFYESSNRVRLSVIPSGCSRNVDVAFLLDQSGSVGRSNHDLALEFLSNLASYFTIGRQNTRVGFVGYSSVARLGFDLLQHTSVGSLTTAIENVRYTGGGTRTDRALYGAELLLDPANGYGAREPSEGIPKIAILMTDGRSNVNPGEAASSLRAEGVQVYTLGIGNYDLDELRQISSDPDDEHVFVVGSYRDALAFVDFLSVTTCESQAVVETCDTTSSTVAQDTLQYFQSTCSDFTNTVRVQLQDLSGTTFLYCSGSTSNPGPLTPDTQSDTTTGVSNRECVVNPGNLQTVYIGVQGQLATTNEFSIVVSDDILKEALIRASVVEGNTYRLDLTTLLQTEALSQSWTYTIANGNDGNVFQITNNQFFDIRPSAVSSINFNNIPSYDVQILIERANSASCSCSQLRILLDIISSVVDITANDDNIDEGLPANERVTDVRATSGAGTIQYLIESGNTGDAFRIGLNTGNIRNNFALDFETISSYTLTVRANVVGTTVFGTVDITITVNDVNELPFFTTPCARDGRCVFDINENEGATSVGSIEAGDPDLSSVANGQLTYRITPSNQMITISSSGVISTTGSLDHETTPTISFSVEVSDSSVTISTAVLLSVNDLNDNSPVISGQSTISVDENTPPGTGVFQYSSNDDDSLRANTEVQFSLSSSFPGVLPFDVDPDDGSLLVSGAVDYEQVQQYVVTVTATNTEVGYNGATLSDSITTTLNIVNLNDNRPVFVNTPYSFSVQEHDNSPVFSVQAQDNDLGLPGMITYSIVGGNVGTSFGIDSSSGAISVTGDIDREAISDFQLRVRATDQGSPVQRRTVTVSIQVDDINDHTPVFNPSAYSVTIRENAPNGEVFTVFAFDNDATEPNSLITYSIDTGNEQGKFAIDSDSGIVHLVASLDFENTSSYSLRISAADQGTPSRVATAVADITVGDVNDVPPSTVSSVNITLPESTPVPSLVVDYDATDADSTVSFTFESGNIEGKFGIDFNSGVVTLVNSLDYEVTQQYQLEVVVSDGELNATSTLRVFVTDENDNSPVFMSPGQFEISEEMPSNSLIGIVNATDGDLDPPNNQVTYAFVQSALINNYVSLDQTTGELRTIGVLDREQLEEVFPPPTSTQTVRIVARDGGDSPQQAFQTVAITLIDINDNTPVFGDSGYMSSLLENLQTSPESPRTVFQLSATDLDLGLNGEIRFSFNLAESSNAFSIDPITGIVVTNQPLDCEAESNYTFTLTASDLGINPRSTSAEGVLDVIDVNDNAPVFLNEPYIFDVSEIADSNDVVAQVVASDADKGLNGEIVFSVVNQNIIVVTGEDETDVAPFVEIDPTSGQIILTTAFNFELQQQYNVTVIAADRGIPRKTSTIQVVFNILNDDEVAPVFPDLCVFDILENSSVGVAIAEIQCTATDEDNIAESANQPLVSYALIYNSEQVPDDEQVFAVDSESGEFSLLREVDRERRSSYQFTIQGTDLSGRVSFQPVIVNVLDVNDNVPVFQGAPYDYHFTVDRVRAQVSSFMAVQAQDPDSSVNSEVSYSISSQEIGSTTTVLEVTAVDGGTPQLTSVTTVSITFEEECLLQQYTLDTASGELAAALLCSVTIDPPAVNVTFGENQDFECKVLYNGDLTFQWIHNGTFVTGPLQPTTAVTSVSYTITGTRFNSGGEYACKASTVVGSLQSTIGIVTVQVPPVITLPPKDQGVLQGAPVQFICIAVGLPEPTINWVLDGQLVASGPVLNIDAVTDGDTGVYTCIASNSLTGDTDRTAETRLTIYDADENAVRLILGISGRVSEDGNCYHIAYDLIISTINRLTSQRTLITTVTGDNICEVSPCSPNPCQNGGSCALNDRSPGGYECSCRYGYSGQDCDQDQQECSESPCENGGECMELFGTFSCSCVSDFHGHRCQYENTCATNNTCNSTDLCVDRAGGIECIAMPTTTTALIVRGEGLPGFMADSVQRYLDTQPTVTTRRKRQASSFTSPCEPRFVPLSSDTYALVWFCLAGDTPPSLDDVALLCPLLLDERIVSTCTPPGGAETGLTTPPPLTPTEAMIEIIVVRASSTVPLRGGLVLERLEAVDLGDAINSSTGDMLIRLEASEDLPPGSIGGTQAPVAVNPEAGIVVGSLILVVLAVALAVAVVVGIVKYKQHRERQQQKQALAVEKAVSMYSLNNFGDDSANRAAVLKSTKSTSSATDLLEQASLASASPEHRTEVVVNEVAVQFEP